MRRPMNRGGRSEIEKKSSSGLRVRSKPTAEKGSTLPSRAGPSCSRRPLPYLYLAAEVFPAAGIPYQTCDALPLAVEPAAAALDLVLDVVASRFARNPLVSLLRSPHLVFVHDGSEISGGSISALNRALSQ